ncbi:MAG: cellulase [Bacteroidetes bacterium]|nr:cellulase [Bacteroidota bacterium]MBS1929793.1 cellulase [Bacteroidota bacterium]
MRCVSIFFLLTLYSLITYGQKKRIPRKYFKKDFPALIEKAKVILSHAYMVQNPLYTTDTIPGWEGFPVTLYEYRTGVDKYLQKPKTGKVFLLNPSSEKLARWVATACWQVKHSMDTSYTYKLLNWINNQSNAQFPVKGVVYEDQYTKDFYEPYVFKDGVTVYIKDSTMWPADKTCTPEQLDFYLRITNDDLKPQTGQYGRISSTNREDYKAAGGNEDVGDKNNRKQKWLDVVRELYKKAWNSDRNELIIIWAKQHL